VHRLNAVLLGLQLDYYSNTVFAESTVKSEHAYWITKVTVSSAVRSFWISRWFNIWWLLGYGRRRSIEAIAIEKNWPQKLNLLILCNKNLTAQYPFLKSMNDVHSICNCLHKIKCRRIRCCWRVRKCMNIGRRMTSLSSFETRLVKSQFWAL
jgi:hypothetical protein